MERSGDRGPMALQTFEALVAGTPDFILVVDRDHKLVYLNHALPPLRVEDALGQDVTAFVADADRERVLNAVEHVFETGEPRTYETSGPSELVGEFRHYHTRVGRVEMPGSPGFVSLIATDVTENKRSEAQMSGERRFLGAMERVNRRIADAMDIEAMLEAVLEEMLDIFDCERAWLLYPCDPAAEFWSVKMERTRPEWPGAGAQGVPIPASDFSRAVFETTRSAPGAHVFGADRLASADVTIAEFGIRSQMLLEISPKTGASWCLGLHNCVEARDYTWEVPLFEAVGRRLADGLTGLLIQQDLRQSEERFRTLLENATEAIVIFDIVDARLVLANDQAYRLFGYAESELLELGPVELSPEFQPDGQSSAALLDEQLAQLGHGETPVFEWCFVHSEGHEFPCEVRLVALPSEGKQLVRGSITDIRRRKREAVDKALLEAQLAQAQKMEALGQLTGGVAHDFNNLLTVILGNLELLGADLSSARGPELLSEAANAGKRAAALTQRLLAFSREQELRPRTLDLNTLIGGIEQMLRRVLGETFEVDCVAAKTLWLCEADPAQLESALLNLAINARDAMRLGGVLRIETANVPHGGGADVAVGQHVRVTVTDTGEGMTPEVIERAFEPFFTTKGPGRGSGLGLSMVFGFVKQSGGHIRLSSELGVGTRVELDLPRSAMAEADPHVDDEVEVEPEGRGQRVLVVEDDESVRGLVVRMLECLGYCAVAVKDGANALQMLEGAQGFDLLFTDVVLSGGMDGVELARAARSRRPELRVLYTSGYTHDAFGDEGLPPGTELLEKPYSKGALARSVHAAIDS